MAEEFKISQSSSLDEQYRNFASQVKFLIDREFNLISNLSNFTAALKQSFNKISWAGFYFYDQEKLYLGPFQGKVACTNIEIGKGVCGTAAKEMKTIIVQDVNNFPGHIFCDADSKSEIVVPLIKDNKLIGVLDLDSSSYNSFNEIDKIYLEDLCSFLCNEIFINGNTEIKI